MERSPRSSTISSFGIFAVLMGAWAGIVVFVGPLFGYAIDGKTAWRWNLNHALLHLAPGAAAVLGGLILLGRFAPRVHFGGLLTIAAGAWLVIGPLAWPVLLGGKHVAWTSAGPFHDLANQAGANLGPGLLLVLAGAVCLGAAIARRPVISRGDDVTTQQPSVLAA
jgi:hypothetical protein